MNALETEVYRPSAAINPDRLDYLWTLAERLAKSSMVPESLRVEGSGQNKSDLSYDQVVANVFAVCEQADRWNQSPFALLSCSAIVHGKLGFEGKVIAAVLEANFGVELRHYFTGNPRSDDYHIYLCDTDLPDEIVAQLAPDYRHPRFNIMDGDVAAWKTTGNGSPWRPATYGKMLVYRGTREWCRVYKPAAIMGILADDELQEIEVDRRARGARDISSASSGNPLLDHHPSMAMERIDQQTGEVIEKSSGAQGQRTSDVTRSSDKPARDAGGETGVQGRSSPNNSSSVSSSQDVDDGAGGDGDRPRLPSSTFTDYSTALLRFNTAENVEKGHEAFWNTAGGKPENSADQLLGKFIRSQHLARAKGEMQADKVKAAVIAAISESYGAL